MSTSKEELCNIWPSQVLTLRLYIILSSFRASSFRLPAKASSLVLLQKPKQQGSCLPCSFFFFFSSSFLGTLRHTELPGQGSDPSRSLDLRQCWILNPLERGSNPRPSVPKTPPIRSYCATVGPPPHPVFEVSESAWLFAGRKRTLGGPRQGRNASLSLNLAETGSSRKPHPQG